MWNKIYQGSAKEILKTFPDESIDCLVTSPPYWNLRDYGHDGQLGLEKTFEEYIDKLMQIFTEVKRVLKKTGTCWVNLGDSYSGSNCGSNDYRALNGENPKYNHFAEVYKGQKPGKTSVAAKSLCCIPDRFKIAMVDDESMDEYELRNDLTKEEKEYVLTELTKRGII